MQNKMLIEYLLLMEIGEAIFNVTNYVISHHKLCDAQRGHDENGFASAT